MQTSGRFTQLDLSDNKLSGTLSRDFQMSSATSLFDLTVNRLSGRLPSAFYNASVLDVLDGNLFQCQQQNIPSSDSAHSTYVCGSNDLNLSLEFAAVAFGLAAIVWAVLRPRWMEQAWRLDKYLLPSLRREVGLVLAAACVSVIITLVLFVVMKETPTLSSSFSTHSDQYVWTSTAAFLHGWAPVLVVMAVLVICLCILLGGVEDVEEEKKSRIEPEEEVEDSSNDEESSLRNVSRVILSRGSMHLINIVIVVTINALYVLATVDRNVSQRSLFAIQFFLGCFKLAWNSVAIPWLVQVFMGMRRGLPHRVFMALFSFVGGPFISILQLVQLLSECNHRTELSAVEFGIGGIRMS